MNELPCYGPRVDDALVYVAESFRAKRRKHTQIPYLTHLLRVAAAVWEHGGDEDQFLAGLLHDTLEDVDGATAAGLADRFGARVARLVEALSDAVTRPKPPWAERKKGYLARLREEPPEVKLVSCCDKIHNAGSIVRDLEDVGDAVWDRFSATKEQTLWYYRQVTEALARGFDHGLVGELGRVVEAMHRLAGVPLPPGGFVVEEEPPGSAP